MASRLASPPRQSLVPHRSHLDVRRPRGIAVVRSSLYASGSFDEPAQRRYARGDWCETATIDYVGTDSLPPLPWSSTVRPLPLVTGELSGPPFGFPENERLRSTWSRKRSRTGSSGRASFPPAVAPRHSLDLSRTPPPRPCLEDPSYGCRCGQSLSSATGSLPGPGRVCGSGTRGIAVLVAWARYGHCW